MAKYVIEDTTLTGIADAIRAKTGGTAPIPATDMASQIAAITGGDSEETLTTILEEQTLEFDENGEAYCEAATPLVVGETYTVVWNGTEYECEAFGFSPAEGVTIPIVGNPSAVGDGTAEDNGMPFVIVYGSAEMTGTTSQYGITALDGSTSATIAIYQKASTGGGSVEGIVYVTFMNGGTELCKTACMKGDSTVDPVADGKIAVPTKEPTVDTVYTYAGGWALTDGGEADELALMDVTEDRVVYAAYTESVREYTVNFYDDDGTTLLESLQVAYGQVPIPTSPEKADYSFLGWEPELAAVTGDTDYNAVWTSAAITFADSSWDTISAVCEAGNAESHFAVGDTRDFTATDGNTYTMRIIGLNVDTKADGSGYAGLTFVVANAPTGRTYSVTGADYCRSHFYLMLPDELKAVLKTPTKKTYDGRTGSYALHDYDTSAYPLFVPSSAEAGWTYGGQGAINEGLAVAVYPGFDTQEELALIGVDWWSRSRNSANVGYQQIMFSADGYSFGVLSSNTTTTGYGVVCGCI